MSINNQLLLNIINTWNISENPEYRGFRCANCQEYKNEAWHHWVTEGGFIVPLHLCNDSCEPAFKEGILSIDPSKKYIPNRDSFGRIYTYTSEALKRFAEIVSSWDTTQEPSLKIFTCDECFKPLEIDTDGVRKGYHVWWKRNDNILAELHFHKECAAQHSIL